MQETLNIWSNKKADSRGRKPQWLERATHLNSLPLSLSPFLSLSLSLCLYVSVSVSLIYISQVGSPMSKATGQDKATPQHLKDAYFSHPISSSNSAHFAHPEAGSGLNPLKVLKPLPPDVCKRKPYIPTATFWTEALHCPEPPPHAPCCLLEKLVLWVSSIHPSKS